MVVNIFNLIHVGYIPVCVSFALIEIDMDVNLHCTVQSKCEVLNYHHMALWYWYTKGAKTNWNKRWKEKLYGSQTCV